VTTVFVELGNTKLELLHPLGENSPIANFLKTRPSGGIHHICLEVRSPSPDACALRQLRSAGA
jgi:methylmalonyl-CoA/ethylmalonyl-CoA epimerase